MNTMFARLTLALMIASLVGCTTLRTIAVREAAPLSASELGKIILPNDKLAITGSDGATQQLVVTGVGPDAIAGTRDGQAVTVRIDQVAKIERRELSGAKTVILVIVIAGGVYLIIAAAKAAATASLLG